MGYTSGDLNREALDTSSRHITTRWYPPASSSRWSRGRWYYSVVRMSKMIENHQNLENPDTKNRSSKNQNFQNFKTPKTLDESLYTLLWTHARHFPRFFWRFRVSIEHFQLLQSSDLTLVSDAKSLIFGGFHDFSRISCFSWFDKLTQTFGIASENSL